MINRTIFFAKNKKFRIFRIKPSKLTNIYLHMQMHVQMRIIKLILKNNVLDLRLKYAIIN